MITQKHPLGALLVGIFAAVLAVAVLSGSAQAQPDVVRVQVVPSAKSVAPGTNFALAVVLEHDEHWHTQINNPKVAGAFPTTVQIAPVPGLAQGPIQWPSSVSMQFDFGSGPEEIEVYEGRAIVYVPFAVAPSAASGEFNLDITIAYQACDESVCMQPVRRKESLAIRVDPAAAATPLPDAFGDFDATVYKRFDASSAPVPGSQPQAGPAVPAGDVVLPAPTFFGIPLPRVQGALGLVMIAILSMVGGLILNLTPCVLPIIPIKINTINRHAGTPGRALYLGLWMAGGVIAFWLGVGVPAMLVTSFADPSRIFGIWWVTFGLGVLMVVMSLGLMGLFQLTLPEQVYGINPKADTAWGSFLFGVMTAVLGLPCFGFVAGALLAAAAALPKIAILAVFAGIGVGMALPYLVLAVRPGLVKKIPRTGPASELVKQVMGLLLIAAAAFFVGSGLIALVAQKPWLAKQLHVWTIAAFCVLAAAWLLIRTFQITRSGGRRAIFSLVAIAVGAIGFAYAVDSSRHARLTWLAEKEAADLDASGGPVLTGTWIDFSEARFKRARAANKIVIVDFTAEWCLTCKALKGTILDRDPVKTALASQDNVLLLADVTPDTAPGWAFLRQLGRTGIPMLAVFTPGKDEPWLANAYTSEQVVEAIRQAREAGSPLTQDTSR